MRLSCGAVVVVLLPIAALGGTLRVPADYSTIQEALDVSGVGDTVLVAPGTYSDYTLYQGVTPEVAILPDGVVLQSEAGAAATTIDLGPLEAVAPASVAFGCGYHSSGLTVIEGFRVVGFGSNSIGAAIGHCSRVDVRDCVFEVADPPDPDLYYRVGVSTYLSEVRVVDCSFIHCSANVGAGITHIGGPLTVEGCTFIECQNQGIRAIQGTGAATNRLVVRDCFNSFIRFSSTTGCMSDIGGAGVSTANMVNGVVVDGCRFENLTMDQTGTISLSGPGSKTVKNCVFHDIDLPTGNGGCLRIAGGSVVIRGNTMAYLHQVYGTAAAVYVFGAVSTVFESNIVAHTSGTTAVDVEDGGAVTAGCNVFWDNADGIGYTPRPTDRIADPLFCDEDARDLTLQPTSPCLPENSLGCGLIGALGQGCGSVSIQPQSWGKTKSAYRSGEE